MEISIALYHNDAQLEVMGLTPADIYQTALYAQVDAGDSGDTPMIIICKDGDYCLAIPFYKRRIPNSISKSEELYDGISPYGYPGFITNTQDNDIIMRLLDGCRMEAAKHHIVSLFLRLHPFTNKLSLPDGDGIKFMQHGKIVYVDLTQPIEVLKQQFSFGMKRDIKYLYAAGYHVKINDWSYYPNFIDAYFETMRAREASSKYFFSATYFSQLRRFDGNIHLMTAHNELNEFVSGSLFFTFGGIAQNHLGGTYNTARKTAPSKIIFDEAISYFKKMGITYFNLGGGVGSSEDSLFSFKARFSKSTTNFQTLRLVCDSFVYDSLVKNIRDSGTNTDVDFFPLYRI